MVECTEGHLGRQTAYHKCGPKNSARLCNLGPRSLTCHNDKTVVDVAVILKRRQILRQSFLIVIPLRKVGSPAEGTANSSVLQATEGHVDRRKR